MSFDIKCSPQREDFATDVLCVKSHKELMRLTVGARCEKAALPLRSLSL